MDRMIRLFRDYFSANNFVWHMDRDVVSSNPKLLFNISGGVPLEEAIAKRQSVTTHRLASMQGCLRTDGWAKIGVSGRHHLAFDMLGHFSIYEHSELDAKELMIVSAFDFLTDTVGLSPKRIHVTVHPSDEVSDRIWKGLEPANIVASDKNTDVNPTKTKSGLRTEILWQQQSGNLIELWNIVFTQFDGPEPFNKQMPKIASDSGMSLDRIVTASEDLSSDYKNSLWHGPMEYLAHETTVSADEDLQRLADVAKATVVLLDNGIRPSNKSSSYVLRKIIREAYALSTLLSIKLEDFIRYSAKHWLSGPKMDYEPYVTVVTEEVLRFEKCLANGERECQKLLRRQNGILSKDDILFLGDTYGYPGFLARELQRRYEE